MKRLLLLSAAIIISTSLFGISKYKVVKIAFGPVIVNGSEISVGSILTDKDTIQWSDDKQAVKALNLITGNTVFFTAKSMKESKTNDIISYLRVVTPLSSRAVEAVDWSEEVKLAIARDITVNAPYKADSDNYYYISYGYKGETINKVLPVDDYNIKINIYSLFSIDGKAVTPIDIKASLYYYYSKEGAQKLISDKLYISTVSKREVSAFYNLMKESFSSEDIFTMTADFIKSKHPHYLTDEDDLKNCILDVKSLSE